MGSSSANSSGQSNTNTLPKTKKSFSTEPIKAAPTQVDISPKMAKGISNMSASLVSSDTISSSPISLDSRSSLAAKRDQNSDYQIELQRKQIDSLKAEIARISETRVDEEKLLSLKKIAEEKQIESAALKFEYRKMKETLSSENNMLKSYLAR